MGKGPPRSLDVLLRPQVEQGARIGDAKPCVAGSIPAGGTSSDPTAKGGRTRDAAVQGFPTEVAGQPGCTNRGRRVSDSHGREDGRLVVCEDALEVRRRAYGGSAGVWPRPGSATQEA